MLLVVKRSFFAYESWKFIGKKNTGGKNYFFIYFVEDGKFRKDRWLMKE